MPYLDLIQNDAATVLTLHRPPANAVNADVVTELHAAVLRLVESADRKALIVTGDGSCFCAGIDVKAVPAYTGAVQRQMIETINRTIRLLYSFPRPTVAALNGHALGAGLVLALTCDYRIAADCPAKFGLTEVTAGIPFPAAPMVVVQAELDAVTVRRLTLTGQTFGPNDPIARSLIDEVCPGDRLLTRAIEMASALSAAPAYERVKKQLRGAALHELDRIVADNRDPLLDHWL